MGFQNEIYIRIRGRKEEYKDCKKSAKDMMQNREIMRDRERNRQE
jgi:hypothetical protein